MTKGLSAFCLFIAGNAGISVLLRWRYWLGRILPIRCRSEKPDAQEAPPEKKPAEQSEERRTERPARISVVFASQTGTAESFARRLHLLLSSNSVPCELIDIEDLEPSLLGQIASEIGHWVVFCVATHGEGEPTDTAKKLFKWIGSKKRKAGSLSGLRYAIMGLGNTQYMHFNEAARYLERHLSRCGGLQICPSGEGDDDNDIEVDFTSWIQKEFIVAVGLSTVSTVLLQEEIPRDWRASERASFAQGACFESEHVPTDKVFVSSDTAGKFYFDCYRVPITEVRELRQQPDELMGKTTKHIEVNLSSAIAFHPTINNSQSRELYDRLCKDSVSCSMTYRTGDTIEVLPSQNSDVVEWMFERLTRISSSPITLVTEFKQERRPSINLDSIISFHSSNSNPSFTSSSTPVKQPFPPRCSLRQALQLFCDLSGCPTREVLRDLASFLKSDDERAKLGRLLSDAHADDFRRLVHKPMLSLRDCVELFMSSAVFCETEADLIAAVILLPRLTPRAYTISSSSLETPSHASMTVVLVSEKETPNLYTAQKALADAGYAAPPPSTISATPRSFKGVCSSYLCSRPQATEATHVDHLLVRLVRSTLTLPHSADPIIMIGAGTGIAPFRAFLREIAFRSKNESASTDRIAWGLPSAVVLFFGCTDSKVDFLYRDEIMAFSLPTRGRPPVISDFFGAFSREQNEGVYVQDLVQRESELMRESLINHRGKVFICGAIQMGCAVKAALRSALGAREMDRLISEKRIVEEVWSS